MAKIWGMTLLNFLRVLGRHFIRPPHFASKVATVLRLRPPPNVRAKPLAAMWYTLTFNISILNTLPQGFIVAHFASKVSYSAAPHASPLYQSCFFLFLNTLPQGFIKSRPYQCKYLPERSAKTKIQNEAPKQKPKQKFETNKALQRKHPVQAVLHKTNKPKS